jgi:glycosyltransferase involved in cell wall biosynthesis
MLNRSHVLVTAHAWYGDTIGGSFRLASEFAQHLASIGHPVTYVCCNTANQSEREEIDGITVHRYALPNRHLSGVGRLRYHVAQMKCLVEQVACESRVDALSGHSPLQFLGAARGLCGSTAYKTFVVHSPFDDELRSNAKGKLSLGRQLASRVAKWVDGRNVRLADLVQTASQYTMDVMAGKHGSFVKQKGVVAPGWVDCEQFQPSNDRQATRRQLGGHWNTDLPIFFTLRRLEERMGLDTLIEATSRLQKQGLQCRVLIGGGGSLDQHLRRMVQETGLDDFVRFLGRVSDEDVTSCYAAADCFVLPTKALECFGLIVLESFAANTPVIASRAAAIPELAMRQGDDWLFAPGNPNELANRMSCFLTQELKSPDDLREIALEFNRSNVLERWTELLLSGIRMPEFVT